MVGSLRTCQAATATPKTPATEEKVKAFSRQ